MVRGRELDVLIAEKVMNWKLRDGYWDEDSKKESIGVPSIRRYCRRMGSNRSDGG